MQPFFCRFAGLECSGKTFDQSDPEGVITAFTPPGFPVDSPRQVGKTLGSQSNLSRAVTYVHSRGNHPLHSTQETVALMRRLLDDFPDTREILGRLAKMASVTAADTHVNPVKLPAHLTGAPARSIMRALGFVKAPRVARRQRPAATPRRGGAATPLSRNGSLPPTPSQTSNPSGREPPLATPGSDARRMRVAEDVDGGAEGPRTRMKRERGVRRTLELGNDGSAAGAGPGSEGAVGSEASGPGWEGRQRKRRKRGADGYVGRTDDSAHIEDGYASGGSSSSSDMEILVPGNPMCRPLASRETAARSALAHAQHNSGNQIAALDALGSDHRSGHPTVDLDALLRGSAGGDGAERASNNESPSEGSESDEDATPLTRTSVAPTFWRASPTVDGAALMDVASAKEALTLGPTGRRDVFLSAATLIIVPR